MYFNSKGLLRYLAIINPHFPLESQKTFNYRPPTVKLNRAKTTLNGKSTLVKLSDEENADNEPTLEKIFDK